MTRRPKINIDTLYRVAVANARARCSFARRALLLAKLISRENKDHRILWERLRTSQQQCAPLCPEHRLFTWRCRDPIRIPFTKSLYDYSRARPLRGEGGCNPMNIVIVVALARE